MILSGGAFDGKSMRRAIQRKTADYFSPYMRYLETRKWKRSFNVLQPDRNFICEFLPSVVYGDVSSVTTKYTHTSVNKQKCPINCVGWTPDARRLITAAYSGGSLVLILFIHFLL